MKKFQVLSIISLAHCKKWHKTIIRVFFHCRLYLCECEEQRKKSHAEEVKANMQNEQMTEQTEWKREK